MTLWQDVKYASRVLRKNPGFTAVVAVLLALGIGANTAIFSLINEIVLKRLPIKDPDQVIRLRHTLPGGGTSAGFPYPIYEQLRDRNRTLAGIFAMDESKLSATVDGQPEIVQGAMVSGSYFRVLGVEAHVGRTFTSDDDHPGRTQLAVISYAYWDQRFGRSPQAIGHVIEIKGTPFAIIGVMPPGFFGMRVAAPGPDIWVPMMMHEQLALKDHTEVAIRARLASGISKSQASADLTLVYQQLLKGRMGSGPLSAEREREVASQRIELLAAGGGGLSEFTTQLRILLVVVGLILLIACANVAGLLLARSTGRQSEIAIRLAAGASRMRLVRQLLTESVLLALLGGALGTLFAWWGGDILIAFVSRNRHAIPPNTRILAFTVAVSLLTGILFGLAPAFHAARIDLYNALRGNARGLTSDRSRFQLGRVLVVSQITLSLMLLIGAGLFIRTFQKLDQVDLGYERDNVLLVWAMPTLIGYEPQSEYRLYEQLVDRLNATAGIRVASVSRMSLLFGYWSRIVSIPGYTPASGEEMTVAFNAIGPRFFETMGIPLLLGREFSSADSPNGPRVAIVGEATAREYFPRENAVGQRLRFQDKDGTGDVEIVGVVRDIKTVSVRQDPSYSTRAVYIPLSQAPPRMMGQAQFKIRTNGDPTALISTVRREMLTVEKNLPLTEFQTQADLVDESLGHERSLATLLGFFAGLALLLAAIGLYGTISYAVGRRTGEIGIRIAIGAQKRDVLWMVLREALLLVVIGIAIGIPSSLVIGRLVATLLFGVSPSDPLILALATSGLGIVGILAAYVPARRAAGLDPMAALRSE